MVILLQGLHHRLALLGPPPPLLQSLQSLHSSHGLGPVASYNGSMLGQL